MFLTTKVDKVKVNSHQWKSTVEGAPIKIEQPHVVRHKQTGDYFA